MLFETSWGWTWDFEGIYNQFEMIFVRVCLYTLALFKSTVEMFLEKCHRPHVTYTYHIPNVSFTWTHGSWGDSVLNNSSTERILYVSWTYPGERIFLAEFQKHIDRCILFFFDHQMPLDLRIWAIVPIHVELTFNFTFSLRSVYVIGIGSCKFYVFNDTFMFPPYFLPALVVLNPDIYHKMAGSTGIRMDRTTVFFFLFGGYYWNIWLIPFFW